MFTDSQNLWVHDHSSSLEFPTSLCFMLSGRAADVAPPPVSL